MVFSSVIFLGMFLPVSMFLYFIINNRMWRNMVLLLFSIVFYAWGEPVWVFAMIGLTFLDFLFAKRMEKCKSETGKKVLLLVAVLANMFMLFMVKYYNFLISSFDAWTGLKIPLLNLSMPIGISFFTFQAVTYVVDVYRENAKVQKNFFYLLLYISMFPQLIAGPIVRYADIDEQIRNREETLQGFVNGMFRFSIGLAKKVVFANYAGEIATTFLTKNLSASSTAAVWIGLTLYTLQLYFDFSGYSDMAIGLGKVFGFDYKENFNYPFTSKSMTEFWARWHISLGTFFRDYVYIPLGGNRKHQLFNLFVVWALTGLWHGASWNFMLWGLYNGLILILEKILKRKGFDFSAVPFANHLYVLMIMSFGMVFFYFTNLHDIATAFKIMYGFTENIALSLKEQTEVFKYFRLFPVMILANTPIFRDLFGKIFKRDTAIGNTMRTAAFAAIYVFAFVLMLNQTYNPFLYFRF